MPDITFECVHCAQRLEAPDDMAGESIECPACGRPILIPGEEVPAAGAGVSSTVPQTPVAPAPQSPLPAAQESGAPPPVPQQQGARSETCPECGAQFTPGAVICVQCGLDFRTGTKIATEL